MFFNVAALTAGNVASAASERILYSFPANSIVQGSVQQDSRGNLYVPAPFGYGTGAIYELKDRGGDWRTKRIHVFQPNDDGDRPYAALTPGATEGTFYGTTSQSGFYNFGTVFSLVQTARHWKLNVLHEFDSSEGAYVSAPMIQDEATGVLYGSAGQNGLYLCGTVFQLDPASQDFVKLYDFRGGADGCSPGQVWQGSDAGTLFGSTLIGGKNNGGTLFLLTKQKRQWTKTVLYTFESGNDGGNPWDITAPANDGAQTIYGVAGGGQNGTGVLFQISKPSDKWVYKVLYTFPTSDIGSPVSLLWDRQAGVLYGTRAGHGITNGAVFKLTNSGGSWSETILHNFKGGTKDGETPQARLFLDSQTGILYGTTVYGGTFDGGTVYAVTP